MSDTPLHHFCNREICGKLCELQDRNVLLLLIDGTAVFGRIGRIDDLVLSVVPAIGLAGLNFVQLRPPNSTLRLPILVSQLLIDVCNVAHLVEGPFILPPLLFPLLSESDTPDSPDSATSQAERTISGADRQHCALIEELEVLQGQTCALVTLGGWIIGGQLGEIQRDCLSLMSAGTSFFPPLILPGTVTIFGPAFPHGIKRLSGPFRVWSNLKALTQTILP
jgi:hypothetical protein